MWLLGKKTQKELEKEQLLFCPSLSSLTSLWPHLPRPGQPLSLGRPPGARRAVLGATSSQEARGASVPGPAVWPAVTWPPAWIPGLPSGCGVRAAARSPSQAVLPRPSQAPSLPSPVSLASLPAELPKALVCWPWPPALRGGPAISRPFSSSSRLSRFIPGKAGRRSPCPRPRAVLSACLCLSRACPHLRATVVLAPPSPRPPRDTRRSQGPEELSRPPGSRVSGVDLRASPVACPGSTVPDLSLPLCAHFSRLLWGARE